MTLVTATQRIFRRHFNRGRQGVSWSQHHQELGTDVWKHGFWNNYTTWRRSQNHVATGKRRKSTCRARRSARRHSVALNVPGRSLRRILQYELHFHPYKLHTGQELSDCDCVSRGASCEQFVTLVNKHTNCSSFHNVAHFWTACYIMFLNDSNAFIFQLTLFWIKFIMLWSSSVALKMTDELCPTPYNFLHPLITSSLLNPQIFSSAPCSWNTLSLRLIKVY